MRRLDNGIRIRAADKFVRLIDVAAGIEAKTRSEFIRDSALAEARRIIQAAPLAAFEHREKDNGNRRISGLEGTD